MTNSRGAKTPNGEYRGVPLTPLDKALADLRSSGHALSPDKLQRLRPFGITSKRVGRTYYFSDQTMRRLSYLLEVEAAFGLTRKHNALALELAYRRYPIIPWRRAHVGARNAVRQFFNMIDRSFQRMTGNKKSAPTERHVVHLSRQMARQLIPDECLDQKLSSGLSRELLEKVLEIILRAAYLDQDAQESEVERLLANTGLKDDDARKNTVLLVPLFNKLRPTLRMDNNAFRNAIEEKTNVSVIRATIDAMRKLQGLAQQTGIALTGSSPPTVEDYPIFSQPEQNYARVAVVSHAFSYACTRWVLNSAEGATNLSRLNGDLSINEILTDASFIKSAVPKTIGMQYD